MIPTEGGRKKKKKKRSPIKRYWWVAPVLAGAGFIAYVASGPEWSRPHLAAPKEHLIEGYVYETTQFNDEYLRFYGKPLNNQDVEHNFELAAKKVRARDFENAVGFLEQVSKTAAIPVVFNDLGVLYSELKDKSRAVNAFREALARDVDYRPTRLNLDRMRDAIALSAEPVSREVEPNNTMLSANVIAIDKPVEGAIDAAVNDVDFYRISTPAAPRDLIAVEITNKSSTLSPTLKVFDDERRILDWGKTVREPGAGLRQVIAPPPNTILYLQVSGYGTSAGAYSLVVKPLKAFDTYEPNDNIFSAPRLEFSKPIDANIMDSDDTDYFSFVSPRNGSVSVILVNRSQTLVPALSTYYPDKRSSGFGPDLRTPGSGLRHIMEVQENQIYYIQIWSRNNTAGEYTLSIE
jgi:hypothetical protein